MKPSPAKVLSVMASLPRKELEGHQGDGDDPVHVAVFGADDLSVHVHTTHVVVVEGRDTDDERGMVIVVRCSGATLLRSLMKNTKAAPRIPHEEQEEGQQLKVVAAPSLRKAEPVSASTAASAAVQWARKPQHGHGGQQQGSSSEVCFQTLTEAFFHRYKAAFLSSAKIQVLIYHEVDSDRIFQNQ